MKIYIIIYFFVFCCLWGKYSFAVNENQWDGDFRVEEFGEQLNDGSQVYLQYNLTINIKNNHASLFMTTWHAGIKCIGDYSLKIKSGILELYYSGVEKNACPYPSPQFETNRKENTYYIRGSVFSYSLPGKWLPLEHIPSNSGS